MESEFWEKQLISSNGFRLQIIGTWDIDPIQMHWLCFFIFSEIKAILKLYSWNKVYTIFISGMSCYAQRDYWSCISIYEIIDISNQIIAFIFPWHLAASFSLSSSLYLTLLSVPLIIRFSNFHLLITCHQYLILFFLVILSCSSVYITAICFITEIEV